MSDRGKVKEAFDNIHADQELKNNTMEFLSQKTKGYRKNLFIPYKQTALVMVCFLCVLLVHKGYFSYFTSVSTISIDVNPSVEFDINRFEKVINVKSYSEDGDMIISAANIRFLDYREALISLLENENMAQYLTQEQLVVITVFGTDEKRNSDMLADLTVCTGSYQNVQCSAGNSEEVAEAHALGLSYGKYKAFIELHILDPDIAIEDVRGLTMRQMRDMINVLSDDVNSAAPDSNTGKNQGHGFGQGSQNRHGHRNGAADK